MSSFEILMPPEDPETGFDKHPEYYSFVKKQNKRVLLFLINMFIK